MDNYQLKTKKDAISYIKSNENHLLIYKSLKRTMFIKQILQFISIVVSGSVILYYVWMFYYYNNSVTYIREPNDFFVTCIILVILLIAIVFSSIYLWEYAIKKYGIEEECNLDYLNNILELNKDIIEYPVIRVGDNLYIELYKANDFMNITDGITDENQQTILIEWKWYFNHNMRLKDCWNYEKK